MPTNYTGSKENALHTLSLTILCRINKWGGKKGKNDDSLFISSPLQPPPNIWELFISHIYIYIYCCEHWEADECYWSQNAVTSLPSHTHWSFSLLGRGGGSFVFFLMPKNILSSFIIMANDPGLQFTLPLTCKLSRKLKKGTQQNLHRFTCRPYQHWQWKAQNTRKESVKNKNAEDSNDLQRAAFPCNRRNTEYDSTASHLL